MRGNLLSQQNLKARLEQNFCCKAAKIDGFSGGKGGKISQKWSIFKIDLAAASSFLFRVKNSHCATFG